MVYYQQAPLTYSLFSMDHENLFADLSSDLSDELDDFIFLDGERTLINTNPVFEPQQEIRTEVRRAEEPTGTELGSAIHKSQERQPKRYSSL